MLPHIPSNLFKLGLGLARSSLQSRASSLHYVSRKNVSQVDDTRSPEQPQGLDPLIAAHPAASCAASPVDRMSMCSDIVELVTHTSIRLYARQNLYAASPDTEHVQSMQLHTNFQSDPHIMWHWRRKVTSLRRPRSGSSLTAARKPPWELSS